MVVEVKEEEEAMMIKMETTVEEEETMTEEEEVVNGMEIMATLEEEEEVVVTVEAAGVVAAAVEVPAGTKAQATTTSIRNPIIEIPTTMILLKAVALLTQVINFQLQQLQTLTLKIIELKGTTTLNPKINTNNLLDNHRLTQLFI